ncbi:DUF3467 domain-containing protein [bacterium]|nr:DUF3467 domain-containing protein [bacterium]NUM82016.1 DUF3467 domain-containing protein [bacterium]
MADEKKIQEIQINFPPDKQSGVYANNMVVAHSKEEFILDFMLVTPPNGVVNARVIMSPGHVKRVIAALVQNMKHYEETFGKIEEASEPKNPFGFQA